MSIDDQLKQIKLPNGKSLYEIQLRRSRITAVILATCTIVSLMFLVFAFVQKAAGDVAREEAVKQAVRAFEQEEIARQLQTELTVCKGKN
jgi:hypothetical protein